MREEEFVNVLTDKDGNQTELPAAGTTGSLTRAMSGTTTLATARQFDSIVSGQLIVDTTFAAGDGAAPAFVIGQTGTTNKFMASKATGTAGDVVNFTGTLTAGKALIVTQTAATGTTSTGAVTVNAVVVTKTN